MMFLMRFTACFLVSLLVVFTASAKVKPAVETLQVPRCLAINLPMQLTLLAEDKEFKIIDVPLEKMGQINRIADKVHCGRFVNVSHKIQGKTLISRQEKAKKLLKKMPASFFHPSVKTYEIAHDALVQELISSVSEENLWRFLLTMSSFVNRSPTQQSGLMTASWLKMYFEHLAFKAKRQDTDAFFVQTRAPYLQPSLVTVIGKGLAGPAIVIGAHMDTLGDSANERMPGGDDDGSGAACVMEVARVLLDSKTKLQRPVYIIWYAAEEQGLVGSQSVVQYFVDKGITVDAVLQLDMTGYRYDKNDPTMWVYRDYTDDGLSHFIARLIGAYITVPVGESKCGYGCSDHASWMRQGIPAAFPSEASFEQHNPHIHTNTDSLEFVSLEHMSNFTKLGLAFAIELAAA